MITLLLTRGHKRLQDISRYHRILHRYLNEISLSLKEIRRNYIEVKNLRLLTRLLYGSMGNTFASIEQQIKSFGLGAPRRGPMLTDTEWEESRLMN